MYLTQVQDARLRLYFRIWEWLRLRRTQTTYRRADGSGRRIEYWVGGGFLSIEVGQLCPWWNCGDDDNVNFPTFESCDEWWWGRGDQSCNLIFSSKHIHHPTPHSMQNIFLSNCKINFSQIAKHICHKILIWPPPTPSVAGMLTKFFLATTELWCVIKIESWWWFFQPLNYCVGYGCY